jgi:CYTH domain-containing protein
MPIEIERKFLVNRDRWHHFAKVSGIQGFAYCQGYIASHEGRTVRVRIAGEKGFLTIKGPSVGYARSEFEYPIPLEHAREMLQTLCTPPLIEKTRYKVNWQGQIWEVDEFAGENQGLILAEIELEEGEAPGTSEAIAHPDWVGVEVSQDPRYYNSNLAETPFRQWGNKAT